MSIYKTNAAEEGGDPTAGDANYRWEVGYEKTW